jgi:FdhD protein
MSISVEYQFTRIERGGAAGAIERPIAVERPIAIEVSGLGYAVMMGTPADLEDFAFGFCRSERLIDRASDVIGIDAHETDRGTVLRIALIPERGGRVIERVRHRVAESGCGLCGIENLEQALRPLPRVSQTTSADNSAIFRALASLREHQPLNVLTGAVHGAALCAPDGAIRCVREDVGRHNALDKLLGAMLRQGIDWAGGFALLSSRCSYELVEKAAIADCPMLVTISAPTTLAADRAAAAGMRLIVLARPDAVLARDHGGIGGESDAGMR